MIDADAFLGIALHPWRIRILIFTATMRAWHSLLGPQAHNKAWRCSVERSEPLERRTRGTRRHSLDRALLFGKAGVAAERFDLFAVDNFGDFLQGGATLTGLLLGLGVEYAFAPNLSAKIEYDHVGYLSRNINLGAQASTNESVTTNTVKAGINYKFYGPSGVVVARD